MMEKGVLPSKLKNGTTYYRASITYKRKHISLGGYKTAKKAHEAYLEGLRLSKDLEITIDDYSKRSPLSFEKWVVIINFRDNNIYFGNPIYIGLKLFYYYLSPEKVLKFDMDDLFYFSSHKIMARGNHYFVADYGMQVSLYQRFGIKSYAVKNRDYRFINGDSTDFRRQNIEIINTYNGVSFEKTKNGQFRYTVRIHIKGNFVVGRYKDETVAAIAYNKAIDILSQNGLKRNYQTNYIENISPREYADIYSKVRISDKITNFSTSQYNPQS